MTTTNKKLKAAVIGVGNMGRHHVRVYSELETVDLVGVADLNEELGKDLASKYKTKYYKSYEELLKIEKPDVVSICVPTRWHEQVALKAIESGCNILLEKPIASSLDEARRIIDAAATKNVKLSVGHIERFNPVVLKAKELIQQGKLGNIISIMTRRVGIIPNQIKDANVIMDIGVHDIDLLSFLLEKQPINIFASGGRAVLKKLEDYADVFLEYPSGVTGHVQVNWLTPIKIRKINITGTAGYAVLNLITQELLVFDTSYTQEYDDYQDFVGKFKESKGELIPVEKVEPLRHEIEHFIEAVQKGDPPFVSPEDAFQALRVAILATENIRLKEGRV